jgi:hypothetical protein
VCACPDDTQLVEWQRRAHRVRVARVGHRGEMCPRVPLSRARLLAVMSEPGGRRAVFESSPLNISAPLTRCFRAQLRLQHALENNRHTTHRVGSCAPLLLCRDVVRRAEARFSPRDSFVCIPSLEASVVAPRLQSAGAATLQTGLLLANGLVACARAAVALADHSHVWPLQWPMTAVGSTAVSPLLEACVRCRKPARTTLPLDVTHSLPYVSLHSGTPRD